MEAPDEKRHSGLKPKRILVTGATGFIGGHVTRYLVGQGAEVSCLARDSSDTGFISDLPVSMLEGDITDLKSLQSAFSGMDAIIHTAARAGDWGSYESFYAINVLGTLNVLQAAVDNSIRRVIITGSVSSYGEENHRGLKDESFPYNSHYHYFLDRCLPSGMNHYRDTKALSTRKAIEFAEKHGLNLIVLEPVWVYGENEFSSGFYEYLKTVRSGVFLMPGSHRNTFHVIYAGDLARAFYLAITSDMKGIHRMILGNPSPEKMSRIYQLFCEAAGLKKPILLPKFVTYPVGLLLELIYHGLAIKNPPLLTRARVNMFYDSIGFNTARASGLLNTGEMIPLEEGIRKTVKWYHENKYL
jgi:nucleoside-diphosphate-sugar epimerase